MLAAGTTVVLWASAFVGIRHVGTEVGPAALTLGRLAVAALVLGLVLLARPRAAGPRPSRRDLPLLLLCGLAWFGAYNVALNAAEQRLDAGTAAMLVNVGPLLIAALAGVVLGEGFPRPLVTGLGVAFAGVLVIGAASSSGGAEAWGVVLCLVAAVAYAVGVVAQKPLLGRLTGLRVTFLACAVGGAACLPAAPALADDLAAASTGTVLWLAYLGVFPTAVAFTTWAFALSRTTAGRMGATTYLVPPLAVLMGWALLGEVPAALALAGGALCLAGVALARRRPAP
ncbi:DMT family transporter [Vallicoccus soli]|uniref:DMT family transporter n=1 Tax=Vallicoccus soli TaxID=2339232 RepID=A0A3A3YVT8_9ACTN|nr:DMT family transporter [Vallicoccus soli]